MINFHNKCLQGRPAPAGATLQPPGAGDLQYHGCCATNPAADLPALGGHECSTGRKLVEPARTDGPYDDAPGVLGRGVPDGPSMIRGGTTAKPIPRRLRQLDWMFIFSALAAT